MVLIVLEKIHRLFQDRTLFALTIKQGLSFFRGIKSRISLVYTDRELLVLTIALPGKNKRIAPSVSRNVFGIPGSLVINKHVLVILQSK